MRMFVFTIGGPGRAIEFAPFNHTAQAPGPRRFFATDYGLRTTDHIMHPCTTVSPTRGSANSDVRTLLHRTADLRDGDLRGDHTGRLRLGLDAAGGAVSGCDAADGAGDRALSRRQRPDRPRH